MCVQVPIYAAQRLGPGRWLVWAPDDNPCAPAVSIVAALQEPAYSGAEKRRDGAVIRAFRAFDPPKAKAPAPVIDTQWREQLYTLARLLDRLDLGDAERFCAQRSALSAELRRLAKWSVPGH